MSKNDSTTEQGSAAGARTALADHIAAILEDAHTPRALRDALWDQINELSDETQVSHITPEVLRVALPLMLDKLSGESDAEHGVASEQTTGEERTRKGKAGERNSESADAEAVDAPNPYQPITIEQAEALADRIAIHDEDEQISAFLKLLHGLVYAALYQERLDVERLALAATHRAFTRTMYFNKLVDEFAAIEFEDTGRLRVITRDELDRLCEPK
jgi:hypothetical protein